MGKRIISFLLFALGLSSKVYGIDPWLKPKPPPPEEYGNLLINRVSEKEGLKAVAFSHRSYQMRTAAGSAIWSSASPCKEIKPRSLKRAIAMENSAAPATAECRS